MKRALVVEGGAMRGIFAAGVLDSFQQQQYYPFDLVVGVSAGATSAAGYLTGMPNVTAALSYVWQPSGTFLIHCVLS